MKYSATIEACIDILTDFDEATANLPGTPDNKFAPYVLDGPQVAAVQLLLWKAKKIEEENARLKGALNQAQSLVDNSISYLDPDC